MFIDPASCGTSCSGWAYFEGQELLASGIVHVEHKQAIFKRLWCIYREYYFRIANYRPEEVHIEQLVRFTHIYTHWSVAVIGIAFVSGGCTVDADIPITSWQRYCDWHGEKERLQAYKGRPDDEQAAIGMGLWYVNNKI